MLMVTRYGYDVVGVVIVICLALVAVAWMALDGKILRYLLSVLSAAALLFTLYFFRDPDRSAPTEPLAVLAPADGRVLSVRRIVSTEYVEGEAVEICIFMSPLNVHVNRHPVSGTIEYFRHYPGEFLVAFDEKASLRNERTHIGVAGKKGRVLFKQIAGFVARRIVAEIREGDSAVAGARFGMIKFGSRVDVILPAGVAVRVNEGMTTVAGETVLAAYQDQG
jgi:phosphatidylserine decarboxylase